MRLTFVAFDPFCFVVACFVVVVVFLFCFFSFFCFFVFCPAIYCFIRLLSFLLLFLILFLAMVILITFCFFFIHLALLYAHSWVFAELNVSLTEASMRCVVYSNLDLPSKRLSGKAVLRAHEVCIHTRAPLHNTCVCVHMCLWCTRIWIYLQSVSAARQFYARMRFVYIHALPYMHVRMHVMCSHLDLHVYDHNCRHVFVLIIH